VVAAKVGFFQGQVEGIRKVPLELGQTELGKSPERLYAVATACPHGPKAFSVLDPKMRGIAPIDQPVATLALTRGGRA
jgi:hypothetical protein